MIQIQVSITGNGSQVLVNLGDKLHHKKELNQLLGTRLAEELQSHFRIKNQEPNKLGGQRTNFWSGLANSTAVSDVSDDGATVTVADKRVRLHIYGGTVYAKEKKALTIPLVPAAHGRRVAQYEAAAGVNLFRIKGKNALFQKVGESVRPIYALVKSATIQKDDEALPNEKILTAAFSEEISDYLSLTNTPS